jgi:hypothetical protein
VLEQGGGEAIKPIPVLGQLFDCPDIAFFDDPPRLAFD